MAPFVLWIDHDHAKTYQLRPAKVEKQEFRRHGVKHHTHNHNEDSAASEGDMFFHEVAGKLAGADELLLVGPGLAKTHFKHHLEKHHHATLAGKIVGVETVDHPTENQVIALARKFFHARHQLMGFPGQG